MLLWQLNGYTSNICMVEMEDISQIPQWGFLPRDSTLCIKAFVPMGIAINNRHIQHIISVYSALIDSTKYVVIFPSIVDSLGVGMYNIHLVSNSAKRVGIGLYDKKRFVLPPAVGKKYNFATQSPIWLYRKRCRIAKTFLKKNPNLTDEQKENIVNSFLSGSNTKRNYEPRYM
jgi:hypothetical protein